MVVWPKASDISRALQNPSSALIHDRLRGATVLRRRDGVQPQTWSGSFAIVSKIQYPNGRAAALRVFTAPPAERLKRYAAVEAGVRGSTLPYFIGFEVLRDALQVSGMRVPVLAMDWVNGATLDTFVTRLTRREEFATLAEHFAVMCNCLERSGIAHGDLQHGNIMVTDAGLRLVDYDGVFVAALKGMTAVEAGHPAYQHPRRASQAFDARLDRFSQLVIYTSLCALAVDPRLVRHVGDQMLFSAADLQDPKRANIFGELRRLSSDVCLLADELRRACCAPPADTPALSSLVGAKDAANCPPLPRTGPLNTGTTAPAWARKRRLTREGSWAAGTTPLPGSAHTASGGLGLREIVETLMPRGSIAVGCIAAVPAGTVLGYVAGVASAELSFVGLLPATATVAGLAWKAWGSKPRALTTSGAVILGAAGVSVFATHDVALILSGLAIGYGVSLVTYLAANFTEHVLNRPEKIPSIATAGVAFPLAAAGIIALTSPSSSSFGPEQSFQATTGNTVNKSYSPQPRPNKGTGDASTPRLASTTAIAADSGLGTDESHGSNVVQAGAQKPGPVAERSEVSNVGSAKETPNREPQPTKESIKLAYGQQLASSAQIEWQRALDVVDQGERDAYVRAGDVYRTLLTSLEAFERLNGIDTTAERLRTETQRRFSDLQRACISDNRGHQRMGTPTVPCP